jgi:predicted nucleic acid-binding protein
MIVISNTSPISNLAAIGHLELLQQLYSNIIIPPAVYQELIDSGDTDPATLAVQTQSWIQTQPVSDRVLLETLQSNLDPGEAEAITLAVEIHADRLIIDERRGRNEAIRLGLQVTGLLGISVSG